MTSQETLTLRCKENYFSGREKLKGLSLRNLSKHILFCCISSYFSLPRAKSHHFNHPSLGLLKLCIEYYMPTLCLHLKYLPCTGWSFLAFSLPNSTSAVKVYVMSFLFPGNLYKRENWTSVLQKYMKLSITALLGTMITCQNRLSSLEFSNHNGMIYIYI
jgi:hypothetical protein